VRLIADLNRAGDQVVLIAVPDPTDRGDEIPATARGLKTLSPAFKKTKPAGGLTAPVSWPLIIQLRAQFGDRLHIMEDLEAWLTTELIRRTSDVVLSWQPEQAYWWQLEAGRMIAGRRRVQLHDSPGVGKTLSTIIGVVNAGVTGPVLVVAPATVCGVWADEFAKWAPQVSIGTYLGKDRQQLLDQTDGAQPPDVLVTSYRTFTLDVDTLTEYRWGGLVLDEFHAIKNPDSQQSRAVRSFGNRLAKSDPDALMVGLSGTPVTHHAGQLWPLLNTFDPLAFPSRTRWTDRYVEQVEEDYGHAEQGNVLRHRRDEFDLTLTGQHRRISKSEVLEDLPPKVYSVRTATLPANWRKAYDEFEADMIARLPGLSQDGLGQDGLSQDGLDPQPGDDAVGGLEDDSGGELKAMNVLTVIGHLTRMASAAADVRIDEEIVEETGEVIERVHLDLRDPSWKVDSCLEILAEREPVAAGGKPVVVAAASRQLVELAGARMMRTGRRVGYITGTISLARRRQMIADFQNGELDVLCLTTGAGREGITLTAADTLIFLQRPWGLVDALQTEDRLHRPGAEQHESINIIDIVASNTIDTRIREVLRERGAALSDLLADPSVVADILGGSGDRPRGGGAVNQPAAVNSVGVPHTGPLTNGADRSGQVDLINLADVQARADPPPW
jgi:SNF2 family DNA or RNA helicase